MNEKKKKEYEIKVTSFMKRRRCLIKKKVEIYKIKSKKCKTAGKFFKNMKRSKTIKKSFVKN